MDERSGTGKPESLRSPFRTALSQVRRSSRRSRGFALGNAFRARSSNHVVLLAARSIVRSGGGRHHGPFGPATGCLAVGACRDERAQRRSVSNCGPPRLRCASVGRGRLGARGCCGWCRLWDPMPIMLAGKENAIHGVDVAIVRTYNKRLPGKFLLFVG